MPESLTEPERQPHVSLEKELFLAEYNSLRMEIVKRVEIQHQLISLALIAPGTILAIGVQTQKGLLVLLYPVFAMFLSAAWSHNGRRVGTIGTYLDQKIQAFNALHIMRWEHYFRTLTAKGQMGKLNFFASQGIFVGTELLAVLVGISLAPPNTLVQALFGGAPFRNADVQLGVVLLVSLASIAVTIIILLPWRSSRLPDVHAITTGAA